ncbi:MAG: alpha-galactosidase [Saccharofermentans sp.]|nr:alpha-galactosidase [Saccharofermentans sp.]
MKDRACISFDNEKMIFHIKTRKTSYIIAVIDGFLAHAYYGTRLEGSLTLNHLMVEDIAFLQGNIGEEGTFMDSFPFEYPSDGQGDFRCPGISIKNDKHITGCNLKYEDYRILQGRRAIKGLPYSNGKDISSLEIVLKDVNNLVEVTLSYSVFYESDIITKNVIVKSISHRTITLNTVMSSSLDIPYDETEVISLPGSWARERMIERTKIGHGQIVLASDRGISSHQMNPAFAVVSKDTTETTGPAWGMALVYSGSFVARIERTQFDRVRIVAGISDNDFEWTLKPGEEFYSPEIAICYSSEGIGNMSRCFHDFVRNNIIRSKYIFKERPVLINNWEATYFDFDSKKLLEIGQKARDAGIEMLVVDDGWFGAREKDNSSLGDWECNTKKIPEGLDGLCDELNDMGLQMGIWFEPEMISPDSDLYRTHPDWALRESGTGYVMCRTQLVLDMTRKEVRDYVYACLSDVFSKTNIKYLKWDMNRPLIGKVSTVTPPGELHHRYMLGVYELQEKLTEQFPYLLIENCCGGGGRFDLGMLYYSPQIWCSDDTDAVERICIQEGTSLFYPPSSMGAHVSVCPNHAVGRITDMKTRGHVALFGTFGYELDITKLSEDEIDVIRQQIDDYKKYSHLIRMGDLYRLISKDDKAAWMFVSKDKTEALLTYVQILGSANKPRVLVRLRGLNPKNNYLTDDGRIYTGDELMNIGFATGKVFGDFKSEIHYFRAVNNTEKDIGEDADEKL